jgi:S1-C subfamily serine protease
MNAELYELVERYLQGKLDAEERRRLEQNIEQDAELAQEVKEYRLLNKSFATFKSRTNLRKQLNSIHQELDKTTRTTTKTKVYGLKVWTRRFMPTMTVAASVAIITVVSMVLMRNYLQSLEHKIDTGFQPLINQNKKIEDKLNTIEQKTNELQGVMETPVAGTATGFMITPNGYLATSQHVVNEADSVYVENMSDHKRYKVEVVYTDAITDLSILKITDKKFKGFARLPYTLAYKESELAEPVYTLAFPRQEMVFGEGSISSKSDYEGDTAKYQVSIPVNPGNSGSPVFDTQGNLVGIVSGRNNNAQGATSAVKSRFLYSAIDTLAKSDASLRQFLPRYNTIHYMRRPDQVKQIQPFVFSVRVYKNKK